MNKNKDKKNCGCCEQNPPVGCEQPVDMNVCSDDMNLLPMLQTYTTKVLKPNLHCCKNILTQRMMNCPSHKYVIKWDFDLNGGSIIVPEDCILEFDGGSLKNGTIVGQDTVFINVGDVEIWGENLTREGSWREHSGGGGGGTIDVDDHLSETSENPVQNKVITNALNEEHGRITEERNRALEAENGLNLNKANKASTLSGYGINDAYTKNEIDNKVFVEVEKEANRAKNAENLLDLRKSDKAITLEGYGISDAYTKQEVRNKILEEKDRAEDAEQELLELYRALTESDIVVLSDTDPWPVANPQPRIIYRVAGTTSYSDYMYKANDLVNPVLMATYNNALDDEPTKDSNNLVKSGGVASVYGVYEENPQWINVALDKEGRILFGAEKDGNFYFGAGVPRQIREKYVEMIEGRTLINKEFADEVTYVENPEFLKVWLDNNNGIILAVGRDGDVIFGKGIPSQIIKEFDKIREEIVAAYKHMETKVDKLSPSMTLPEKDTVFATYDNIVAKFEEYGGGFDEGGGEYFYFSDDVGNTWSEPVDNTLGNDPALLAAYDAHQIQAPWDVVHTKIFSDGSLLLFTYFKCFYIKDYQHFIECTVYDYKPDNVPGNPPVYDMRDHFGNIRHGFYTQSYHDKYLFHNGVEMEVFGEYRTEDSPNVLPREYLETRMWYTVYTPGQPPVIKCAFKSGTTEIDGRVINIRHFHSIAYCEANGKFYIGTGDEEAGVDSLDHNEIYFIEASYDVATDKWSFRILGEGYRYKFGHMWFDDKYAYILTDYTQNHFEEHKGILRCPIDGLDNIDNYKNIYTCPSKDWGQIAVTNIVMDDDGNKVLFPDYLGNGLMWVSNQAFNFKKVKFNPSFLLGYDFTGPNLNGDIYAVGGKVKNNYCYNLTKMFRENGLQDFFKTTLKFK